jgi:RES domain-containing protein
MGDAFIREGQYAVLQVPSAVVNGDSNFLINPFHPDFKKIKITSQHPFLFDQRLIKW